MTELIAFALIIVIGIPVVIGLFALLISLGKW